MFLLVTCILLHSPSFLVELSIDRSDFPEGAASWHRIGLFELKDGKMNRPVLLYYSNNDWIYPNYFAIHALCRSDSGKWKYRKVLDCCRIGFSRINKVTSDCLTLECRPQFQIRIEPGTGRAGIEEAIKQDKEMNKPFDLRLSFDAGVLKAVNAANP